MRKNKIYSCEFTNYEYVKLGENRDINLEYSTIINDERGTYGIEILKKEKSNLGTEAVESNCVLNYTSNENEIMRIIEKLAKNKVTPVCLNDVMENFGYKEV